MNMNDSQVTALRLKIKNDIAFLLHNDMSAAKRESMDNTINRNCDTLIGELELRAQFASRGV